MFSSIKTYHAFKQKSMRFCCQQKKQYERKLYIRDNSWFLKEKNEKKQPKMCDKLKSGI